MDENLPCATDWLIFIQSLQAIAQTGLAYTQDVYDKERYQTILHMVAYRYAQAFKLPTQQVAATLFNEVGYPTPKLAVRGFICEEDRVLLVQERTEGLWSLPGGWADVNVSPSECLYKEVKEETGFDCHVMRLMALWDKQKHDHPSHWPHTYQLFFDCELTGGEMRTSHEVSAIDYFKRDDLPPLSTHRVTAAQIAKLFAMKHSQALVECDYRD